jgi:hypothetical protein
VSMQPPHCAVDAGDMDKARELAHRSLRQAEACGWTAGRPTSLSIRCRSSGARSGRARHGCGTRGSSGRPDRHPQDFAIRRIAALHELGTAACCKTAPPRGSQRPGAGEQGRCHLDRQSLTSARERLEHVGGPRPRIEAARRCRQRRKPDRRPQDEQARSACWRSSHGVREGRRRAERAAEEAERLLPATPELLLTTWGQGGSRHALPR